MKLKIEIDEATVKQLVLKYIQDKLGNVELIEKQVRIETKSKQNYRSEWEVAAYRAVYDSEILIGNG